ncbi:MAG: helix-turn-helix transcriptional regulator [Myxococcaceae bacterium]
MRRLKTSLLRGTAAEQTVLALCEAGLDAGALRVKLREPLSALVGFEGYCVNTCDPASGAITSSVGDGLPEKHARRLFELEAKADDFNSLAALFGSHEAVVTLSGATRGDVSKSVRMREVLGPLGFRDELRAALKHHGACWGYLHLLRKTRDFSSADAQRVRRVLPAIGQALCTAMGLPAAASHARSPAVVLFDSKGAELVGEPAPMDDLASPSTAPHAAQVVASRARVEGRSSSTGRALDGSWMTFHARKRRRGVAVVISPAGAREALAHSFAAAGLTGRQREVAQLIASGADNEAIARRLEITLHTAKDHVKAVLAKLGLKRRSQLAGNVV